MRKRRSHYFAIGIALVCTLVSANARAEFTSIEKANIERMQRTVEDARWLEFYAADELRLNPNPAAWPKCIALGLAAHALQDEARQAVNHLVGSLTTDVPSNRPLSTTLAVEHRVASAMFYWERAVGGYRNGQARTALDALKPLAVTANVVLYADRLFVNDFDRAYADIDLTLGYENREPAWWPFLVRREADGLGVHGHFEFATEKESQGIGYIATGTYYHWIALAIWSGNLPSSTRAGLRNLVLSQQLVLRALNAVQLAAFGIGPDAAGTQDDFDRLFRTTESALVGGGAGLRVELMFGSRNILRDAIATQTNATLAEWLAEGNEKLADGWGHAVDLWSWDAIRFPCIEGFESVGCAIPGTPVEPLLPK